MARYLVTGRIRLSGAIVERLAHLGRIGAPVPEGAGPDLAPPATNPPAASTETADEPADAGSDATAGASPDAPARSVKGDRP